MSDLNAHLGGRMSEWLKDDGCQMVQSSVRVRDRPSACCKSRAGALSAFLLAIRAVVGVTNAAQAHAHA